MVHKTTVIFHDNVSNLGPLDLHVFRKSRIVSFSKELLNVIIEAYDSGIGLRTIGNRVGVDKDVIKRILTESGKVLRDPAAAQKVFNARLTPEERGQRVASANDAWRSREWTKEDSARRATSMFRHQALISSTEEEFLSILETLGYTNILQQVPCGVYNIDFVIGDTAIEVFGGNWHNTPDQTLKDATKLKKLLDTGYRVIIIWVRDYCPLSQEGVKDIFATFQLACSDETSVCKYGVFYGNGELISVFGFDGNGLPHIPFSHKQFRAYTSDLSVG
jgi:very-short-patch-repair endonuclease